jgi:hypothetical protein
MKKFISILFILMIASFPVLAQEELGSEVDPSPPSMGGDIPVDGGLSLLLAAGAAFGSRRLLRGVRNTTVKKVGD